MEVADFSAQHPWVFPGLWGIFFTAVIMVCRRVQLEYTHEERHHHQGTLMGFVLASIPIAFVMYVGWLIYAKSILAWLHPILVSFGL